MNTLSIEEKTEMQIYSDIASLLDSFFKDNLQIQDWIIRQWGQSSMQTLRNNVVLMNYTNGRRYGWVSTNYQWDKDSQTGTANVSWIREIKMSLSFFKYRSKADINYVSADDIARKVLVWLQSDFGLHALRNKGYEIYVITDILNPPVTIEDDKYERMPIFDITLVLKENHTIDVTENFVTYTTMAEEFRQRKGIELISV